MLISIKPYRAPVLPFKPQHILKRSTPRLTFGTRYCCTRSTAGIRPSVRSEHFLARSSSSRHDIIAVHPLQGLKRLKVDDDERVRLLTVAEETRFRDALVKRETNLRAVRDRFNEHRIARHKSALPART